MRTVIGVGPDHPELHREPHRWSVFEPVDPSAQQREFALGERLYFALTHFACFVVPRHHDELRKICVREMRVEGQIKTRAGRGRHR